MDLRSWRHRSTSARCYNPRDNIPRASRDTAEASRHPGDPFLAPHNLAPTLENSRRIHARLS